MARLIIRFIFHRILTTSTPIGRKVRPKVISQGGPLIRNKPRDFVEYGIKRIPKIVGVRDGFPVDEDQHVIAVKNIIWSTGFYPAYSWIDIPIFKDNEPIQNRGIVENEPGLYFVGSHFLYSFSSAMIHGAERDAEYVVDTILSRL